MLPIPFLAGFTIMSLASLIIYAKGSKVPPARTHTYFHATVPFIAATAYLAMAFGIGDVVKPDLSVTFVARYFDWSITTPILLAGLTLTALHEREHAGGFLVAIITLDVLMILTGLISSLAVVPVAKWVWFAWSCVAFLGVLYILWGPLKEVSRVRGGAMDVAYGRNLVFLTVVWFLYPIVFAIGPEGTGAITAQTSVWSILVLDVIAKVVYAFYAAANVERALGEDSRADRRA
jgi:bacteriorhodopsin